MGNLLDGTRLITVDLDDTLWPCAPVIRHAEERLFAWLDTHAPELTAVHDLTSLREHRKRLAEKEPDRAHDLTWLRREHLRQLLEAFGYEASLADEGVRVFRQARNLVSPYEDVIPVLESLRENFALVSVTNGNVDLDETPLGRFFDHHVDAAQAGAAKPDPAMFRLALAHAGEHPDHALHLGDDPLRDIAAAMSVGMRAVWVNRNRAVWPRDIERPHGEVTRLDELLAG